VRSDPIAGLNPVGALVLLDSALNFKSHLAPNQLFLTLFFSFRETSIRPGFDFGFLLS
jgi:hypothetical protein